MMQYGQIKVFPTGRIPSVDPNATDIKEIYCRQVNGVPVLYMLDANGIEVKVAQVCQENFFLNDIPSIGNTASINDKAIGGSIVLNSNTVCSSVSFAFENVDNTISDAVSVGIYDPLTGDKIASGDILGTTLQNFSVISIPLDTPILLEGGKKYQIFITSTSNAIGTNIYIKTVIADMGTGLNLINSSDGVLPVDTASLTNDIISPYFKIS